MSLLIFTTFSLSSFAQDAKWGEEIVPYNYNLKYDVTKNRKCPASILDEVKSKNTDVELSKIKTGDILLLPKCASKIKKYQSKKEEPNIPGNTEHIESWKSITTPAGFILSKELVYNKYCSKIWTKQIYSFLKKNPKIKNVNKIPKNVKISLQACQKELDDQVKKTENNSEVKDALKGISDYLTKQENSYVELYGGYSNIQKDHTYFIGIANRSNLIDDHGYNLKLFYYGNKSLLINTDLELKTKNHDKQYYLGVGLGNYILLDQSSSSNSYFHFNAGTLIRPNKDFVFESFLGLTFSKNLDPNFYISGQFKKGNYWRGLFLEYKQISNPVDSSKKQIFMAGFKFSL